MLLISSSPTANVVSKAATAVAVALIEAQKAAVEKAEAEEDEREFMAAMLGERDEDEGEDSEEEDGPKQGKRGGGFEALPPLSRDASTAIDHFPAPPAGAGDGDEADENISKPICAGEATSQPHSTTAGEETEEARPATRELSERAKLSAASHILPGSSEGLRVRASSREVTREGYLRTTLIERQSYSRQGSAGGLRRTSSAGSAGSARSSRSSMRRSRASSRESVYGGSRANEEDVFQSWLVRRLTGMQVRRIPQLHLLYQVHLFSCVKSEASQILFRIA